MNLFERRRELMGQKATPAPVPETLGEYTAGYYNAALTPTSASEWVITHNMGVVPKVVIVEPNFEPTQGTNAQLKAIYAFDVYGGQSNIITVAGTYWYNNAVVDRGSFSSSWSASETEVSLPVIYSTARSPWKTTETYTVRILG